MFRGVFTVNLDAKGRMALPTRLRGGLQVHGDGSLVVTVHRDGCLLLYPLPEWEEVERKVMRIVTPGTVTDEALLSGRQDNLLAAAARGGKSWAR